MDLQGGEAEKFEIKTFGDVSIFDSWASEFGDASGDNEYIVYARRTS